MDYHPGKDPLLFNMFRSRLTIHSDYFPFESISAKLPVAPHFSKKESKESSQTWSAGMHDVTEQTSQFDLSIALNYGQSMGPPQLIRWITEHNEIVHNPPYSDWDVCMTSGSTSALEVTLRLFCNPGEYVMTEEYSFSSAMETIRPMGLGLLGIKMDKHGMLPDDLDRILSNWDETARKAPKPFLVYTVPSGQNPTGSTQPLSRRKALYAIAEKHDLFILEDEPYYFLQMEPFVSGVTHTVPTPFTPSTITDFLSNLIPSYLSPRHLRPRPTPRLLLQNHRPRLADGLGHRPRTDHRALHPQQRSVRTESQRLLRDDPI